MASITFDYDDWDGKTESIPGLELPGTLATVTDDSPFDMRRVRNLLIQMGVLGYSTQSSEYAEASTQLVTVLWCILAWFRRQGIPAADLERLVKDYPNKRRAPHQKVLDASMDHIASDVYSDPLSIG